MPTAVFTSFLFLSLSLACQSEVSQAPVKEERALSPESAIFPAPLDESRTRVKVRKVKPVPPASKIKSKQRPSRKGLLVERPLMVEPRAGKFFSGLLLDAELAFSRVQRTVVLPGEQPALPQADEDSPQKEQVQLKNVRRKKRITEYLWPQFRIQISEKDKFQLGRLNMEFRSRIGPFSRGIQLRSRVENSGSLLLWPDRRDHRTLPEKAVSAFFREGRVDITPLLPSSSQAQAPERYLGRAVKVQVIKNELLELRLVSAVVPQVAGQLLCDLLLSIGRVASPEEFCLKGFLPLRAEYRFLPENTRAIFQVLRLVDSKKLEASAFAMPPKSGVHRPRDLPLRPKVFWSDSELKSLGFEDFKEDPINLKNQSLEALYLLDGEIPVATLRPGQEVKLTAQKATSWSLIDLLGIARGTPVDLSTQKNWLISPEVHLIPEKKRADPEPN